MTETHKEERQKLIKAALLIELEKCYQMGANDFANSLIRVFERMPGNELEKNDVINYIRLGQEIYNANNEQKKTSLN